MPLNLAAPLSWTNLPVDQAAALKNLQGNILKGHGRQHTLNLLFQFTAVDAPAVRAFLKTLPVTNAFAQLTDADAIRAAKSSGKKARKTAPFVALMLSSTGYQKLGVTAARTPADPRFRGGLKASRQALQDPPTPALEAPYRGEIDALIVIADSTAFTTSAAAKALLASKPAALVEIARETGVAYRNANGDGLEHFGYVDGRSQPLMIQEDIDREESQSSGTSAWNPAFPLKTALVPEPGGGPDDFGSYLVFRKLEQDVKGFRKREMQLARALNHIKPNVDLAGALVVGRFRDGTAVQLQNAPGMNHPVSNNFAFGKDGLGLPDRGNKCPMHAHIRKVNPRGDVVAHFNTSPNAERDHIMPRRGITYGKRKLGKNGFKDTDQPSKGVGLLFMAYNADIDSQFEFVQEAWMNQPDFVQAATGTDPVAGQGGGIGFAQSWPTAWGGRGRKSFSFGGFVRMRGGEYFFAPSLAFIAAL